MKSVSSSPVGVNMIQNMLRTAVSKGVIFDLLEALIEPDEEDINIHEPPETESMFLDMQSPLMNSAGQYIYIFINPYSM